MTTIIRSVWTLATCRPLGARVNTMIEADLLDQVMGQVDAGRRTVSF